MERGREERDRNKWVWRHEFEVINTGIVRKIVRL